MNKIMEYKISTNYEGKTIEFFLKSNGYSRPLMIHLKKTENGILLNGIWAHVRDKLKSNDILTINIIEEKASENIPASYISKEAFQKMVVYEDEDILLMNKPSGLAVHPSLGHYEDTLANYCAYHYTNFVFRCINRIDRDTSGLVLIAKNMLSSAMLSSQQTDKKIHRKYLAIASGITEKNGTIDMPIARKEESVIERCIDFEKGDTAVTHYTLLETGRTVDNTIYSLLMIELETGRTHQIRVHMKAIGHPLPGDFLYNPDTKHIKRQALHSYQLTFNHPISGKTLSFTVNPPEDFYFIDWKF